MRRSRLKIFLLYFAPQFSVYTKFGIDPSFPPSLFAVRPCTEHRSLPVRTNRGALFLSAAGIFRPRLGSMEFGFCGSRRVGWYGADRLSPAFSRAALYFCFSNKVFIGDDAPSSAVKLHFLSGVRTGPRRRLMPTAFFLPILPPGPLALFMCFLLSGCLQSGFHALCRSRWSGTGGP